MGAAVVWAMGVPDPAECSRSGVRVLGAVAAVGSSNKLPRLGLGLGSLSTSSGVLDARRRSTVRLPAPFRLHPRRARRTAVWRAGVDGLCAPVVGSGTDSLGKLRTGAGAGMG
ncbi:hypothetical protein PMIN01_00362 [Paraphaeosphaeria minitans]|uniref:Uncharacterized protein n=1 Tax=Paraphaeosphaeria minitans TaxID=565426 RepID=A0A9P6GSN8_9PLEO|nr:hypothetical protein PMIN01_00362 [Paraphaeosphaeria minitans]